MQERSIDDLPSTDPRTLEQFAQDTYLQATHDDRVLDLQYWKYLESMKAIAPTMVENEQARLLEKYRRL